MSNKVVVFKDGQLMKLYMVAAVLVAVVLVGSFFIGAIMTCQNGGGDLSGFTCSSVEVVGVCQFGDQYYIVPGEDILNWSST